MIFYKQSEFFTKSKIIFRFIVNDLSQCDQFTKNHTNVLNGNQRKSYLINFIIQFYQLIEISL